MISYYFFIIRVLSMIMYLIFFYMFIKKFVFVSDFIVFCVLIIENKLIIYYILGYNLESLKNNLMRNREVMRVMERVYNFLVGLLIFFLLVLEKV